MLLHPFAVLLLFHLISSALFNLTLLFCLLFQATLFSLSLLVQDDLFAHLLELLVLGEHLRHLLRFQFPLPFRFLYLLKSPLLKLTHFVSGLFFFLLKAFPCLLKSFGLFLPGHQDLLFLEQPPLFCLLSLVLLLLLDKLESLYVSPLHFKSLFLQHLLVLFIKLPSLLQESLVFSFSLLLSHLNLLKTHRFLLCKLLLRYFILAQSFQPLLLHQRSFFFSDRPPFFLLSSCFFLNDKFLLAVCLLTHQLSLLFVKRLFSVACLDLFSSDVGLNHFLKFFFLSLLYPLNSCPFQINNC